MKLLSLHIEPKGTTGWASALLHFGRDITELYDPANGVGKTPIVQSIAFALGYPAKFRDDILKNCAAAVLVVEIGKDILKVSRRFDSSFDVSVEADGKTASFYNEGDFTAHLFNLLGIRRDALTSTQGEATYSYMATLLPIFYLDQDVSYSTVYKPPSTFIKDQFAEMIRSLFDIAPKNSFERKKQAIVKKREIADLDRKIVNARGLVEHLLKQVPASRRSATELIAERASVEQHLTALKSGKNTKSESLTAVEGLIFDCTSERKDIDREIETLQVRVDGFDKMQQEIEIEIDTLSLNEEARRVFSSFNDICSNSGCGLFLGSAESYGKNLLYLRDQIKDLQRINTGHTERISRLQNDRNGIVSKLHDLLAKQRALEEQDDMHSLIAMIGELTGRLVQLEADIRNTQQLEAQENTFIQLTNGREKAQNDLASYEGSANLTDLRPLELRSSLRERVGHWLDVLGTKNVPREVGVDSDFEITFGNEKLNQFHGSTRLRIVLAIHSALFELYVSKPDRQLRFLILDTPRQHDIESAAFSAFISELKKLASEKSCQIIFSTTEFHYPCAQDDIEWRPTFATSSGQKMFLDSERKTLT